MGSGCIVSCAEVSDDSILAEKPLLVGPSVDVVEAEFGRGLPGCGVGILDLASLVAAKISLQWASSETESLIAKLVGRESTFSLKRRPRSGEFVHFLYFFKIL